MTPQPFDDPSPSSEKWVAVARVALGMAQMIAALTGIGFLIVEGLSGRAAATAVAGLILTITSKLIFGRRKR